MPRSMAAITSTNSGVGSCFPGRSLRNCCHPISCRVARGPTPHHRRFGYTYIGLLKSAMNRADEVDTNLGHKYRHVGFHLFHHSGLQPPMRKRTNDICINCPPFITNISENHSRCICSIITYLPVRLSGGIVNKSIVYTCSHRNAFGQFGMESFCMIR